MNSLGYSKKSQDELREEAKRNSKNGCVGREMVLENARVRIWRTVLEPGERMAYHSHTLDFIWIAISDCNLIFHDRDGSSLTVELGMGEVVYKRVPRKAELVRAVCNIGLELAHFEVVEFLESENSALPIPEHVRKR